MNVRRFLAATVAAASLITAGATAAAAQPAADGTSVTQTTTSAEAAPGGAGTLVGTTMHSNSVSFLYTNDTSYPSALQSVDFTFSGDYSVTGGQPWGGVSTASPTPIQGAAELVVTAQAGRHDSPAPAQFFGWNSTAALGADADHNGTPSELNFAFSGTLTINGNAYPIVIGQGSNAQGNNWWVGGQGWTAGADGVIVSPDGQFQLTIDGNPSTDTPYANAFCVNPNN